MERDFEELFYNMSPDEIVIIQDITTALDALHANQPVDQPNTRLHTTPGYISQESYIPPTESEINNALLDAIAGMHIPESSTSSSPRLVRTTLRGT